MPYVFAYFRQIYGSRVETSEEGVYDVPLTDHAFSRERLHLATSEDGIVWSPLGDDLPFLPEAWVRDPFLARGSDGAFHMIGTTREGRHHIVHVRSRDLIRWEPATYPQVIEPSGGTHNVWAPEFVIDPATGDYLVYWSSSFGPHGWDDSRIWCARTRDFESFTSAQLMLDPGFTVIDATIVPEGDGWAMFVKDERFGHVHGEHRYIQKAVAERIDGPYTLVGEPITETLCEGPATFRLPDGRWGLAYDRCMADDYALFASRDLEQWEPVPEARFPANARHGSVVEIGRDEIDRLLRAAGESLPSPSI